MILQIEGVELLQEKKAFSTCLCNDIVSHSSRLSSRYLFPFSLTLLLLIHLKPARFGTQRSRESSDLLRFVQVCLGQSDPLLRRTFR